MRSNIVTAFGKAAKDYDAAAIMQREVAERLITHAAALNPRTILDIGCGTGLVTTLAARHWPQASITAQDAAPAMLAMVQNKLPHIRTICSDAATLTMSEQFELITASMMLHWLPDPLSVIEQWRRLLAPHGVLLIALPVAGSLPEWQELCCQHGLQDRLWPFTSAALFPVAAVRERVQHFVTHGTAYDFLRNLKASGAHSGNDAKRPSTTMMRRLLRAAPQPFMVSYEILYLRFFSLDHSP